MGNSIFVPYSVRVQESVRLGSSVTICGRPHPNCKRFSINLCSGANVAGEVPLHFNPRFDKGYVCCNSMYGGKWASEQHTTIAPFSRNVAFEMQIKAEAGGYAITVNNNNYCQFPYRVPKEIIQFLVIAGDISIDYVYYSQPGAMPTKPRLALTHPIQIPFSTPIPLPVKEGFVVTITGRPHPNCKRFSINLSNGPSLVGEVPLHFNPRYDKGYVCCNSMYSGQWATEQHTSPIPFSKNMDFDLKIRAQSNGYEILVNGTLHCQFPYRIPKDLAKHLVIEGDVHISSINFDEPTPILGFPQVAPAYSQPLMSPPPVGPYPPVGPSPPVGPPPPYYEQPSGPVMNPTLPLNIPVRGGMFTGKIILIVGKVNPNSNRFTVNLMNGPSEAVNDILLHFDVRLRYGNDTNVVVRNHRQNAQWGNEERDVPSFPFIRRKNFEMMFLTESGCFKVAVNNDHFVQFNHRMYPFEQAAHLNVSGDISVTKVQFQ